MDIPKMIDKQMELRPSQDYAFLREQGLEYIQNLSNQIWTDHNDHDPGITILEVLCYALTDLGYRTDFKVRDLLAVEDGTIDPPDTSGLFPAHEVLPTAPFTISDYRKLLLKIEGVRNAWLDPMADPDQPGNYFESEQEIYLNCPKSVLTYDRLDENGKQYPPLRLRGLYKVLLELDVDDELGPLTEHTLIYRVRRGPLKGVPLSITSQDPAFLQGEIDFSPEYVGIDAVDPVIQNAAGFSASARIQVTGGGLVNLTNLRLQVADDLIRPGEPPVPASESQLEDLLEEEAVDGILALFWKKQHKRAATIQTAGCVLQANRNLCEDFLSITTVPQERVTVCADIELKNDADLEEVQARVFHAIELYFNPPVRYHSLQELLKEGLCPDEIFNGPFTDPDFMCGGQAAFTKPGFVTTNELENTDLRRELLVSDIINILMDFDEIISIRNVLLRRYDPISQSFTDAEPWCLMVTPGHQPVLYVEKPEICFYKNDIPYRPNLFEFLETLEQQRAQTKKAAYIEPHQVLDVKQGRYRQPDAFFSIQEDFPKTYGTGKSRLPTTATHERDAQARQLKAYLTFYDQVLADYLCQLSNVRRLFSLDEGLAQTYFTMYLDDIPALRDTSFEDEFYIDKVKLQDDVERLRLTEDETLFLKRRNRLLDHLLARFAETFTDYVLLLFDLQGNPIKTGQDLIKDKIAFLREYPVLSRERGKAFNYQPEDPNDIWDTDNVAGLKKRVSRLLGIEDFSRRDLACTEHFDELFKTRFFNIGNGHRVEVKSSGLKILFKSQELFPDPDQALEEARKLYPHMRQEASYQVDTSGGVGQVFYTLQAGGVSLRNDELFETEADALRSIRTVIDRYDELLDSLNSCNQEGFYLIEHILLRPLNNTDPLLNVCLEPDCNSCSDEDPYSFRISVILPYWPPRFRQTRFRRFFEHTFRLETPAHILPRICWAAQADMQALDSTYRAWLEAKAEQPPDPVSLTAALNDLVTVLKRLKSVHPAVELHDFREDRGENPILLDRSNIGIF